MKDLGKECKEKMLKERSKAKLVCLILLLQHSVCNGIEAITRAHNRESKSTFCKQTANRRMGQEMTRGNMEHKERDRMTKNRKCGFLPYEPAL